MVYFINLFTNLTHFTKMEEKKITEQESISIITEMISRTKERYIGDGNIMLMWGWLIIAVTGLVWLLLAQTCDPVWNWLWFLIPVVGGIATPVMARKSKVRRGVKTYSDKITSLIWTVVGIIAIAATLVCIGFGLAGIRVWTLMFVFGLVIVPFTEITQGLIVKESSLIAGGACGMTIGLFTSACLLGQVPLYAYWFMPVYMLAFACMMLVPGYIINHKARKA